MPSAEPNFQSKFLYVVDPNLDKPQRLAKLTQDFGNRIPTRPTIAQKNELFKDPSKAQFEERYIRPFPLTKYGFTGKMASVQVHVMLHEVLDQAFTELASFSKEQHYEVRDVGGFYLRYAKCPSTEQAIRDDPEYIRTAKAWHEKTYPNSRETWAGAFNVWALQYDLQVKGQINWGHVSNHAWGIAIDINPGENPLHGLKFDMPVAVVKLMRKYGFCWGGYYQANGIDAMHFEYNLLALPDIRRVYFPFSTSKPEPPPRYYQLNETHTGGYYPVGLHQTLHGGAHVHPDAPTPVVSPIPGYVVAARIMAPGAAGDNAILRQFVDDRPLSFVLLRHELNPIEGGQEKPDKAFALYSIYMHLDMPNCQAEGATFKEVPWLQRLLDLRFGGVVQLDPSDPNTFGTNHWASKKIEDGAATFPVRDGPDLPAKKNDRQVGLAKPPPEDVVQAIEAFTKGAVVTFSQPLLQVDAGEPIGLAKGYVHWEFFAPSGAASGIAKLLEQAGDWKSLFKRVKELSEDNFLELPDTPNGSGKNEIKPILVDTLPDDERQLVDGLMDSHRYETALTSLFQQARSFAKAGEDKAKTQEAFTYPIKLSLTNKYAYKGPKPSQKSKIDVSFTRNVKVNGKETPTQVGKKGSIDVTDFNQLEFVIQVPALADSINLSSGDFFLDRIPLTSEDHIKSRVALLETLAPFRWRHLLLEHVNEWTPSGLALLLDELEKFEVLQHLFPDVQAEQERLLAAGALTKKEAPRDAVRTMLKPLAWWARKATDADPFGEVPIYGPKNAEESLFGTKPTQLPPDAKIDNLHPVTAAWLLDLLADAKRIAFRERWPAPPLTRSETTSEPPYCSFAFASAPPKVGDQGFAVLVQHGYGEGDEATFKLEPVGAGTAISIPCASKTGVFKQPLLYSFWGTWQLKALDDKGGELKPRLTPTVQLVTEKPVPADASLPTAAVTIQKDKKSVQIYRATAKLADHCPNALAGYVYFRCWKTTGAAPDFSSTPEIGKAAIPVVARKVTFTVKDVEIVDGFVKNAKAAGTRITESFSWGELHQAAIFQGSLADFRIDYQLCQRLQLLRTKAGRKLSVTQIQASGLELTLKPQSGTKADFKVIVKALEKLPAAAGFTDWNDEDNLTITLSYVRPEQEPGELQLEFDPKATLARVVGKASAAAGESVFVKASFIAPNGGHYLLGGAQPGPGENDPDFDLDGLKAASDALEFHSDLKFGPFKKLGMGPIRIRMTAGGVATDVALYGDINQWKAAAPKIKLEGPGQPVVDGKLNGTSLTASWVLFQNGQPHARWGNDLTFSVQIAHPEKLESAPTPPASLPFTASPQLEELIHDDSVQGKVRLVGKARAVPTDRDLTILCEKQDDSGGWVPDDATTKAIKYQKPGTKGCGLCDENGQFVATFDLKCCSDGRKRRFTWKRVAQEGKIGGLSPGSVSVEYPS